MTEFVPKLPKIKNHRKFVLLQFGHSFMAVIVSKFL